MKKLLTTLMFAMGLNFLVVLGAAGWLYKSGHLDKTRVTAIKEILFPPATEPSTQPADVMATTKPASALEQLLARHAAMPPSEQVEFIRHTFDAQSATLDQRERELKALQEQVAADKEVLAAEKEKFNSQKLELTQREEQATKLAGDTGFQESLQLYQSMPAKQVKTIFMGLDNPTVIQYLQAMDPRDASRITKEFKLPAEMTRLTKIMELMRQATTAPVAVQ